MNLGALIDVGVPPDYLRSELTRLKLDSEFELSITRAKSQGIAGTFVRVQCKPSDELRNLKSITEIIERAPYSDCVKRSSVHTFKKLAEAEATVHDTNIKNIHFHEVGAVDAIVDIVGSAIAMEYLQPSAVYCSPIELGSGTVQCEHGTLPVPAPATLELLKNKPTTHGRVPFEATTPTGAAILCQYVDHFEVPASFRTSQIGYGVGEKTSDQPNVLRVSLGETNQSVSTDKNVEIECNVDDMNPEAYEYLFDELFKLGALDVFITPILMKKSRPANKLTVLAPTQLMNEIVAELWRSTTTAGVRVHNVQKLMLERSVQVVCTSLGDVRVKQTYSPNGTNRLKIEHDDVLKIAKECTLSYLEARARLEDEVKHKLNQDD